ncbi:MAG: Mrp/NBP35 family ATP-binding protein [Phycisphaerales bacterium]|nr:Mrp/NBP35 family ATP-binding protein [Phycisphaerales bacterium]
MAIEEKNVMAVLQGVVDPRQIKSVKLVEENVLVELSMPSSEQVRQAVIAAVKGLAGVEEVVVHFGASLAAVETPVAGAGIKHIVAVGAGKGGVGKSTIAVNLAVGLAKLGKRVGLLDADIYGPSVPTLTGLTEEPKVVEDRILPVELTSADGAVSLKVMSIGFLVDREKALIWRGPMAHGAIKQFLEQVDWIRGGEELDYLIVDLPPGTGDIALTLAQTVSLTGAVVVATPQEVALADARRAVRMFQQLGVAVLGVVENMSYFVCEHGTSYDIFGRGGAMAMAQEMNLPFLGEVPIDVRLRKHSDEGTPFDNFAATCASSQPLTVLADELEKQIA